MSEKETKIKCTECGKLFVIGDKIISIIANEEEVIGEGAINIYNSVTLSNYHKECSPIILRKK